MAAGIKFGAYNNNPNYLTLGANLRVPYQRMSVDNTAAPWTSNLAHAASLRAAGFGIQLTVSNGSGPSFPPADLGVYATQIAGVLTAFTPELGINICNEVDAHESDGTGSFYQDQGSGAATAAAYAAQLSAAVPVARSMGYDITGDALSSAGSDLAYWHWLWTTGQHSAADAFSLVAFDPSNMLGHPCLGDIPNSANPTRGVLLNTTGKLKILQTAEALIPIYAGTGVSRLNVHAYWNQPNNAPKLAALQWVSTTTRLPLTCNEMGQRDTNPLTARAMIAMARTLNVPMCMWFCPAPGGMVFAQAQSPGDANGALYPFGSALRDAMLYGETWTPVAPITDPWLTVSHNVALQANAAHALALNASQALEARPGATMPPWSTTPPVPEAWA